MHVSLFWPKNLKKVYQYENLVWILKPSPGNGFSMTCFFIALRYVSATTMTFRTYIIVSMSVITSTRQGRKMSLLERKRSFCLWQEICFCDFCVFDGAPSLLVSGSGLVGTSIVVWAVGQACGLGEIFKLDDPENLLGNNKLFSMEIDRRAYRVINFWGFTFLFGHIH